MKKFFRICQRSSEFALSAENEIVRSKPPTAREILSKDIPSWAFWGSILSALSSCCDYKELETLVNDFINEGLPDMEERVPADFIKGIDAVDEVTQKEIPHDGPKHYVPVWSIGDGNCLPRALSKAYYNTDTKFAEIRARIVIEGVKNKKYYLNTRSLECGATYLHKRASLPFVFGTYSEYYTPGQKFTENTLEYLYCVEIYNIATSGSYMGLWQLAQASSVL